MKHGRSISAIILFLLLWSCSNTRFLTEDQLLYTGREKLQIIQQDQSSVNREVKTKIKSVTEYKVNNALFGRRLLPPVGLWVSNYWKTEEDKKVLSWIQKSMAAPPVLLTEVNPELRAQKIQSELFDLGYFRTRAWSEVEKNHRNPKKVKVSYFIEVAPPYLYNQILFDTLRETIDTLISQHPFNNIKPGDQYNLEVLKSARSELFRGIQDKGYFYINPDFIELTVDTSLQKNSLNMLVGRKAGLPQAMLSTYEIDNIYINVSRPGDTNFQARDTSLYGDLFIVSKDNYLNQEVLSRAIYFKRGESYSYTAYQNTISRLNELGVFSYVQISFQHSKADSLANRLNVSINLTMTENINLDLEAEYVTKSTGYAGPNLMVGLTHTNAFKGAEKVHIGITGGIEWQLGKSTNNELGTFSYEIGINTGISLPKILLPASWGNHQALKVQQTSVNVDFSLLNRTAYYKMFSSMINFKYNWGKTQKVQHSYSPLYLNSVSLLQTTPAFDSVVNDNIYIKKSFEEQFIFGPRYEFIYDNTFKPKPRNLYFHTAFIISESLIGLFAGEGKDASDSSDLFLNYTHSQFVKFTTDFRYYFHGINQTFACRLYAGIGMPYGNSTVLPYVEQFFSGGAYSIRGFAARYLGPGSYYVEKSGYVDQTGDIKLEGNLEYRFGLSKIVKGALFLETGNIWLINEDENRPGAKFEFNSFYKELAVGTGLGLRFDFNFFVLRTDLGLPLRNPYQTDGKNWLFKTKEVFSGAMIYLAIGYPF